MQNHYILYNNKIYIKPAYTAKKPINDNKYLYGQNILKTSLIISSQDYPFPEEIYFDLFLFPVNKNKPKSNNNIP